MFKLIFENDEGKELFMIFKDEDSMYKFIKENEIRVIRIMELQ